MQTADGRTLQRDNIVEYIGGIFERRGCEEYLGEDVTMAAHMLQGARLAEEGGQPDEIIVAALLHDIGHFTSEFGSFTMEDTEDRFHEQAGAELLAPFFPALVSDCVRYHVAAKRYLCATRPAYHDKLSEASRRSLELQGGPMTPAEVEAFEQLEHRDAIVAVRYLDDAGKDPAMQTPSFSHYAPLIQRVIDRQH